MTVNEQSKIVVISCVSPPETVVAGRVNYDICEYLSKNGNNVTLITPFPSRPLGKFERNDSLKEEVIQVDENFVHVRINSFQSPQFNFLMRIFESFSFGCKSAKYINMNSSNVDLIYATPWPFIGQLMFVLFRRNKNEPVKMNRPVVNYGEAIVFTPYLIHGAAMNMSSKTRMSLELRLTILKDS